MMAESLNWCEEFYSSRELAFPSDCAGTIIKLVCVECRRYKHYCTEHLPTYWKECGCHY